MPSASSVFDSGLDGFSSPYLDKIVRNSISRAMETLDISAPSPGPPNASDLLNDMGDYCSRTAMMWDLVTENLLKGPHLEQAARKAHERSCTDSGMSDLSEVARIDMDIDRLRYDPFPFAFPHIPNPDQSSRPMDDGPGNSSLSSS